MKRFISLSAALAVVAAALTLSCVRATTYYVDGSAQVSSQATGTAADPFRTIGDAAKIAGPGDTVLIRSGIYREFVQTGTNGTAEKPIVFEAAPGAYVLVTGADELTQWQSEPGMPGVYNTDWPHSFLNYTPTHSHPDDARNLVIGRCEQVFISGYALQEVLNKAQLAPGTFYVDLDAKKLYAAAADFSDLTKPDGGDHDIEANVRTQAWNCTGSYVTIQGIHFRYAASTAEIGAVMLTASHDVLEGCTIEDTNATGVRFDGPDEQAIDCEFRDNGDFGFAGARADRLHIIGCTVENNNTKNFPRQWGAGGVKLVLSRDVVIESSQFLRNRGHGVWLDIGDENFDIHNCLVADNEDGGIFDEISYGLHVHDNVIARNGLFDPNLAGQWGADAGVCLSSSPDSVIERNLIVGNREGFDFREQPRVTPRIATWLPGAPGPAEPIWNHDETIRNNVMAYNRDAQVWGWFAARDQRNWPLAMQIADRNLAAAAPKQDIAADYLAKGRRGQPTGLSLDKLAIAMTGNIYAPNSPDQLFRWGPAWDRHIYYDNLAAVRSQLGEEQNSIEAPVEFGQVWSGDYRVPKNSPVFAMDCYPHGDVPGVRLGAIAD